MFIPYLSVLPCAAICKSLYHDKGDKWKNPIDPHFQCGQWLSSAHESSMTVASMFQPTWINRIMEELKKILNLLHSFSFNFFIINSIYIISIILPLKNMDLKKQKESNLLPTFSRDHSLNHGLKTNSPPTQVSKIFFAREVCLLKNTSRMPTDF